MAQIKFILCILKIFFVSVYTNKLTEELSWKQIDYDFDGVLYRKNENFERRPDKIYFMDDLDEKEKFFIQYNNVPIGFEYDGKRVFVTVPRRRYGIPSTLNYINLGDKSPSLRPYPDGDSSKELISVYRPRIDACKRLWMVDTGLLEVPGDRRQIQNPAIVVYDLKTNKRIFRHELKDLLNERTSGGLTSITVDVTKNNCNNAYAYITDLATSGLIVFSLKDRNVWTIQDPTFSYDESALNFTVAGHVISWRDGLFSIALAEIKGKKIAFYHPLMSTNEYSVDTGFLKNNTFQGNNVLVGNRGLNSQSGSHAFHAGTKTMFYANVARDAISCWNIENKLAPESFAIAVQDHDKLLYISDLKVIGDDLWVLVNQIPRFVFSTLNTNEPNYFIHKGRVSDLIRGTVCERKWKNK